MHFKEPKGINTCLTFAIKTNPVLRQLSLSFSNAILYSDISNGYFPVEFRKILIVLLWRISALICEESSRQAICCLYPKPGGASVKNHFHFLEVFSICVIASPSYENSADILLVKEVCKLHVVNWFAKELKTWVNVIFLYKLYRYFNQSTGVLYYHQKDRYYL